MPGTRPGMTERYGVYASHSGAARSAEPGIYFSTISRSRVRGLRPRPGMTPQAASLLGLAGILHALEGGKFHVVEFAVDLLDFTDIDVLHDVAGFRIDGDWPARAFPFHSLHRRDQ